MGGFGRIRSPRVGGWMGEWVGLGGCRLSRESMLEARGIFGLWKAEVRIYAKN